MTEFRPRPAQARVLRYQGGKMGVVAVPGSGKTWTLSRLAAQLIRENRLRPDQEILVVTLVNSAVENFKRRIGEFIQAEGLIPQVGYRVRTLHGLANDIVRERPDLVGLAENFQIVDERVATQILDDVVATWLRSQPLALDDYFLPDLEESRREWLRRERHPDTVRSLAVSFMKRAKDWQLTPEMIAGQLAELPARLPLAEMGYEIYRDYQRALAYRGAVDFDDLIRLAATLLELEPDLLRRLRHRWPYVLEDEAQDSSQLQERILRLLTGESGNWVRVGDPNQAIFETFTTANPEHLRKFLQQDDVVAETLPNSGRSSHSVIDLANHLIEWTRAQHPVLELRRSLDIPFIQPAPAGDPQPNPEDRPDQIHLIEQKFNPRTELKAIADSLERWLPDHANDTVAVLVPRNARGFQLAEELRRRGIDFVELLRSARATRLTAGAIGNVLNYLADPKSPQKLSTVFRVWRREDRDDPDLHDWIENQAKRIAKCHDLETYLWPGTGVDWLDSFGQESAEQEIRAVLLEFRRLVRRWQEATELPIDQLVLTLAQDLFQEPAELALAHKLAIVLKRASGTNLDWRLPELTEELKVVAKNQRHFIGFSQDETGFEPEAHRGRVVITTMHKAKGLEWDRVYLMSVSGYDFPSAQPFDSYISERWFIRDRLDLQAETLEQLRQATFPDEYAWYEEGQASELSRLDYSAERLRLLYVGITRAKRELVVTWNTGRSPEREMQPALPLTALQTYWKEIHEHASG